MTGPFVTGIGALPWQLGEKMYRFAVGCAHGKDSDDYGHLEQLCSGSSSSFERDRDVECP